MRGIVVAGLAAVSLALSGCGDDPTQPEGTVTVTVTPVSPIIEPGGTANITVTAVPTAGLSLDYIILEASGVITERDSIPGAGTGAQSFTQSFPVPLRIPPGDLVFTAVAHAGEVTGTGTFKTTFADTVPPQILSFQLTRDSVLAPGDTEYVSYEVADNFGLRQAVLSWSGAVSGADTLAIDYDRHAWRSIALLLPRSSALGEHLTFQLSVMDGAGATETASSRPVLITDYVPATVTGSLSSPESGVAFQPGDALQISATGEDNLGLTWLGYSLSGAAGSIRDSVAATGLVKTVSFSASAAGWTGTSSVRVFARDMGGNLSETALGGVLVLGSARSPSIHTINLHADIRDLTVDEDRGLIYASLPDSNRIAIVSLQGDSVGDIDLPSRPSGLDLSADGGTLVVAQRASGGLAVVSAPATAPTVRSVPVVFGGGDSGPDRVRVAANGKAIVSITFAGSGYGGSIYDYDLLTGAVTQRTEAGFYGSVTESTPMARSFDRTKIFALIDDSCCPEDGMIYDADTGRFGPAKGVIDRYFPAVSVDYAGSRFLVGNLLFDDQLDRVGGFTPAGYDGGVTALGPAGFAAFAVASGVSVVRVSDGAVVDTVSLPFQPALLQALSDGHGLLAAAGNQLAVITLW